MQLINNTHSSQPRVLLLGANRGRWNAKERPQEKEFSTGIEAWCHAFDGDYCDILTAKPDDIKKYDIVIGNTNSIQQQLYSRKLVELAESRPASTKWISLIEGSATEYFKPINGLISLLNASDLINAINAESVKLFRALTTSKVE